MKNNTNKVVHYDSNNSGGRWWLTDKQWDALERAGWEVEWRDERFLGARATSATRQGLPLARAIREWERATGENADARGCKCCGQPHTFSEE